MRTLRNRRIIGLCRWMTTVSRSSMSRSCWSARRPHPTPPDPDVVMLEFDADGRLRAVRRPDRG
jgi:hypothetical protein